MVARNVPRLSLLLLAAAACGWASSNLSLRERLVYCAFNLRDGHSVATLEGVMRRAARAGYTGIVLSDFKFGSLSEETEGYFANARRVKELAAELHLEIVPALFPIGDSRSLLANDPNLAEGLPVRDALFVVRGGVARLEADPPVELQGGGAPGTFQTVEVHPFRQYHVSVRVKTEGFTGTPLVSVMAGDHALNYADLGVQPTQAWTEHHATFNSLDHSRVTISLGSKGGQTGSLSWANARLEEVGLLNVVRREGAPLVVKREDGALLVEGKDFDPIADPLLGRAGGRGRYDVWHEPPLVHTHLPDGTRLRTSYHHAVTFHGGKVMICPSEPKTIEILRDQAARLHRLWGARAYFMSHDEVRALNWDESCRRRGLDAGAILADNARTCIRILRELDPRVRIYVWSDMFDPNANARRDYYLVRGDLAGSWEGLDPEVVVALWTQRWRRESLRWFSGRHRVLIAGYYDSSAESIRDWLRVARGFEGVIGVMYTTWQGKYGDLERFAEELPK